MNFTRISPHEELSELIECYWMMQDQDTASKIQKIIPDGYTELIFNYGGLYRIKMDGPWRLQTANLFAGQINSYFFLENTGATASFAIKMKPAAMTQLFGLNMYKYVDKISDINTFPHPQIAKLNSILIPFKNEQELIQRLDSHFLLLKKSACVNPLRRELRDVFESNGTITVQELCAVGGKNERQLQRLFKKYIGISPKYYIRIIRFNYIFQLLKEGMVNWTEVVFRSGYYDQSHFIRDFKCFTGEDPSAYNFKESNMANFFLNK